MPLLFVVYADYIEKRWSIESVNVLINAKTSGVSEQISKVVGAMRLKGTAIRKIHLAICATKFTYIYSLYNPSQSPCIISYCQYRASYVKEITINYKQLFYAKNTGAYK